MRTGEVFALTWDDIDFSKRTIRISKTVYAKTKDEKGRWYLGIPKTEESFRNVYMCDTLFNILKKYQIKQVQSKKVYGQRYYKYYLEAIRNKYGKICEYRVVENKRRIKNAVDFVFARINGRYVGTDIVRYPYKIIHHELNIKDCRFYDLRGSFATRCLRSGIEIKDISEILGHKSIETTENYYICSLEADQRYANEVFEKLIQADIVKI